MSIENYHLFEEFINEDRIYLSKIKPDTIIILDTNILLNSYRNSKSTNRKIFNALLKVKENLWIPNNVFLEFLYDRKKVKFNVESNFKDVNSEIKKSTEKYKNDLKRQLDFLNLTSIDLRKSRVGLIQEEQDNLDKYVSKVVSDVKKLEKEIVGKENYVKKLIELLRDKIGLPYNQERIDEIEAKGLERYKKMLPPGYKDDDKGESTRTFRNVTYRRKFGDLIIWNQIIDFAKENTSIKNVVFITEDKKEDWIYSIHEKKIGPRMELKSELFAEAQCNFFVFDTNNLLKQVNGSSEEVIYRAPIRKNNNYEDEFLTNFKSGKSPSVEYKYLFKDYDNLCYIMEKERRQLKDLDYKEKERNITNDERDWINNRREFLQKRYAVNSRKKEAIIFNLKALEKSIYGGKQQVSLFEDNDV